MTTAAAEFQLVPVAKLHPSPLNPRKTVDAKKLDELTASIRAKGVLTPLLVRPNAPGYEIAAGHRRHLAAVAAGVELVPAVIREMSDAEFLELLIFENDEREDLHPLEEAQGYHLLMMQAGYDVTRLAERRGCSVKYIYDRVKLLQLTKEAQKIFLEGKITAGHAILLARLKPADQTRCLGDPGDPESGGLFKHENLLWDPDQEGRGKSELDPVKPVSVRELEAWSPRANPGEREGPSHNHDLVVCHRPVLFAASRPRSVISTIPRCVVSSPSRTQRRSVESAID